MSENENPNILVFPFQAALRKLGKRYRMKNIDGINYFNSKQIKLLRRQARYQAEFDEQKGKITGIREWLAIDLLLLFMLM